MKKHLKKVLLAIILVCPALTASAEPTPQQQEETAKEIIISRIKSLYEALLQHEATVDGRFACHSWLKMVAAVNKKDESEDIGFFNDDIDYSSGDVYNKDLCSLVEGDD